MRKKLWHLFEQVSEDIKNAMKAKDKVALETLRNVKKFFLEAKTAPGANDTLTDADALKIMQKLVKQGKDSAAIYVQQGRQDLADVEPRGMQPEYECYHISYPDKKDTILFEQPLDAADDKVTEYQPPDKGPSTLLTAQNKNSL